MKPLYYIDMEEPDKKYYVYQLIDPRNGAVFYVGKGQGWRMRSHSSRSGNRALGSRIRAIRRAGLEVKYKKVFFTSSEQAAYNHEKEVIAKIGLANLCNLTSGGGKEHYVSDEAKHKQSKSMLGNIPWNKGKTGSQVAWNKGKTNGTFSKEHKQNLTKAGMGRVVTVETRKKIAEGNEKKFTSKETRRKMSESAKRRQAA